MVAILSQPPLAPPSFTDRQSAKARPEERRGNQKSAIPLRGWVSTTYRNYKGKRLGPYYVRRWKVGNKLHREYINAKDLERVKTQCELNRERRSRRKETTHWLTNTIGNLNYIVRMCKWSEQGRLRPVDTAFISLLEAEGYAIPGRPSTRRRVQRTTTLINGKEMIVTTVFELDGTTKTFVAPLAAKRIKDPLAWMRNAAIEAWETIHGKRKCESDYEEI